MTGRYANIDPMPTGTHPCRRDRSIVCRCTNTADLEASIASARSSVQAVQEGYGKALQAVVVAERASHLEEVQMTETALDEQVQRVEAALCAALVERYRICFQVSGSTSRQRSLFNSSPPRVPLRCAVINNEAREAQFRLLPGGFPASCRGRFALRCS